MVGPRLAVMCNRQTLNPLHSPSRVTARLVYRWKYDLHSDNAAIDAQTGTWIDRRYGESLP